MRRFHKSLGLITTKLKLKDFIEVFFDNISIKYKWSVQFLLSLNLL